MYFYSQHEDPKNPIASLPKTQLLHIIYDEKVGIHAIIVMVIICFMELSFPNQLEALDEIEMYLVGYGMAARPSSRGLTLNGSNVSGESVKGHPGLGLKIGLFPSFFQGYLGAELETFGHNNSLRFPVIGSGMSPTKGESSLIMYGSMVNLLLRYPGRYARPYVGIGGGLANGILHHTDIPERNDKAVEMDSTLGYQYLGGIQLVIAKNWFVFGEYKYSVANYHWNQLSLNFRNENFIGGFGYIF